MMLTEKELKKIIERITERAKINSKISRTKRIICTVDLGVVVLEVTMGLN